ncbi:transcription factor [Crucibulum laeve]|uniref:Transcription factor n=1 Tax=Crucibulum laeve TaxID=68775 RepID=A0A5C3M312_9AGAR|nr:transcription factor [Crucibulum laeve]
MQSGPRAPGSSQPPVKIYNAVYSSVQVYECMVRGIAVMRRRNDSYVNATQILKVAGVDKGRRTKILEKEILPGKHEIVQGGYGKYQGTWIPLERGRDIALQYGVAPLLSPLFDFTPSTNSLGALPVSAPGTSSPRPLSASSSYSSLGQTSNYLPGSMPSTLAPPPIMPGSALRLLNQGRAQGLFTPSTSGLTPGVRASASGFNSPGPYYQGGYGQSPFSAPSQTPPPGTSLKRNRSETDVDALNARGDPQMDGRSRPPSTGPQINGEDNPSPAKRPRKDDSPSTTQGVGRPNSQPGFNGSSRPPSSHSVANGTGTKGAESPELGTHTSRFASKPSIPRVLDAGAPVKDNRRAAVIAAICQRDDPQPVMDLLREICSEPAHGLNGPSASLDVDLVLDDQGHTALHLAASLARQQIVDALIASGSDIHRGNYLGETPLIRACLATHNADHQTFHTLVIALHPSIRTLDTSRKTVIHHIVSLAGVKGRAVAARYYLDQIFYWIAEHQDGDFQSIIDLQDEHGDTALNIAARVGNRSMVRTLLDLGANRILPNKLGLRPGDFGVETEELSGGPRAEDILSSLRTGPPVPVQKSQDVIADMTTMIQGLSTEFQGEVKSKQDALDVTQAHLRAATRELSEQRKQIQAWQSRCAELDQINHRVRNVVKAINDEDQFDWTGRTDLNGNDARDTAGPAFQYRGPHSTMLGIGGSMDISFNVESEPPMTTTDSVASLIRLRRLKLWHSRMEDLVKTRLKSLQGVSAEKEYQCKKIVALCTGISIDKVEDMLDNLLVAVESEAQIVDIGRVSGFMQKVRDGII